MASIGSTSTTKVKSKRYTKKINGKTYLFDSDGKMQFGWQYDSVNDDMYYYGDENDGARVESQWLWLEKSGNLSDEDIDDDDRTKVSVMIAPLIRVMTKGWYWFQSSGKAYHGTGKKKKINGRFYMFNEHGQMLYEWIDNKKVLSRVLIRKLDAARTDGTVATAGEMLYYNEVEDGSRGNGWVQRDGSEAMKTDNDTDWYYIDDGEMLNTLMAVPKTSLMMTELYTFRESKLKANTSHSTKKVRCRMAYSTARLTADSITSMTTAIRRLAA